MQKGKIYKIVSDFGDECYVGSTFSSLNIRFSQHKSRYKKYCKNPKNKIKSTSFYIFEKYGINSCKIVEIKEYAVCNNNHLKNYENLWMYKLKSVNRFDSAGYIIKTSFNLYKKYKSNYDKKRYKVSSCDKILYSSKYREKNLEKVKQKQREKVECSVCNTLISKSNFASHKKSMSHRRKT